MSETEFSPVALLEVLRGHPRAGRYWVAYSGGLDSTVLLEALAAVRAELPGELRAVHVNHALQPQASGWAHACLDTCRRLDLVCEVRETVATPGPGESPEAAARGARYRVFAGLLGAGEALLTGHQRDDQAETLLLHLFRGSGPQGLAGMPACRPLGAGWLGRPLLGWSRASLRAWAQSRPLTWIEDPSNRDTRFDRNFVRHEVLAVLERRWPGIARVLARAAQVQGEAQGVLEEVAQAVRAWGRGQAPDTLSVGALRVLPAARRRLVLRHWLRERGLPPPAWVHLDHVLRDVLEARADAAPRVRWPGGEVWRYRDDLFASVPGKEVVLPSTWRWQLPDPLALPFGTLEARPCVGQGVSARALEGRPLEVRLRRGGERCRLPGRPHGQALKKLLQDAGVPPPARRRLPLVFAEEILVAVADLWVCAPFAAGPGEPGWCLRWRPRAPGPQPGP
jgi:tRNA(Ile)-lysidine synthase